MRRLSYRRSRMPSRPFNVVRFSSLLAIIAAISACAAPSGDPPESESPISDRSVTSGGEPIFNLAEEPASPSSRTYGRNFIADAAEIVSPSVVQIRPTDNGPSARGNPESFRRFFEEFGPNPNRPGRRPPNPPQDFTGGAGSGFIIDGSGTIVTNAHVVGEASSIEAVLYDGREFKGTVVGRDPLTDLAVIQLETEEALPTVELGNSGGLRPGEWVIALGSPLGLSNSLTAGIVSALGRTSQEIRVGDRRIDFIQTDAAINPGNSGGPLIDIDGKVVGINTAIIRGAEGIGFAIPMNKAQIVIDQLISSGKVVRSFVGIRMNTLDEALLEAIANAPNSERINLDPTVTSGVLVIDVLENSPADDAGLQSGDVIVELDGEPVLSADGIQSNISGRPVGDRVQFRINRNGDDLTLTVITKELQQQFG